MHIRNGFLYRLFSQLTKTQSQIIDHSLFKSYDKKIVLVRNCPEDWRESHLQKYFDRYLNTIDRVVLGKNNVGEHNNTAYLFFKNTTEASEFIDRYHNDFINTTELVERLNVSLYTPKTKENKLKIIRDKKQIELYNLPFEATNMDVLNLITDQDQIENFQMPMRSLNKNKGFALITFKDGYFAADFLKNIEGFTLFGRELKGRAKYISFDTQKKRKDKKSDFIIEQAETAEIAIKGAMDRYAQELFQSNNLIN